MPLGNKIFREINVSAQQSPKNAHFKVLDILNFDFGKLSAKFKMLKSKNNF